MTERRLSLGKKGEDLAAEFLKRKGYRIRERNYRSPLGEIDIIALDGATIVFVEVKTRSDRSLGEPFESVTAKKQKQIIRTALYYLSKKRIRNNDARVDVVSILMGSKEPELELIRNAFEVPV